MAGNEFEGILGNLHLNVVQNYGEGKDDRELV